MAEYLDVDYASAPIWCGDTQFVMRHVRGAARPGLYARGADGRIRDLLDLLPDDLASAATLHTWQPSLDGHRLALTFSVGGSEDASLYVMDVETGGLVDGPIDGCGHTSIAWPPGGRSPYYVRRDPTVPEATRSVYLHHVGSEPATDEPVFGNDKQLYYSVSVRRDGRWLAVSVSDGGPASGNELWLADLDLTPPGRPRLVKIQDRAGHSSEITFGPDGLLYIMTNRDAPHWRIMVADPERAEYAQWQELVGPDTSAVITDFAILDGDPRRLLVSWSRDAVCEVSVHDRSDGSRLRNVPLPAPGTVGSLVTRAGDGGRVWFSYTNCTTSPRVLEYHEETGAMIISTTPDNAMNPLRTHTRRVWCESADATRIQLIVVRPLEANGPAPTILSGSGGFGVPTYSASAMAWVRAGGNYVIANLRGGGERGELWHAAGRQHLKQNTIDDFLACAQHLIGQHWTTPEQLAIWDGSNGAVQLTGDVLAFIAAHTGLSAPELARDR